MAIGITYFWVLKNVQWVGSMRSKNRYQRVLSGWTKLAIQFILCLRWGHLCSSRHLQPSPAPAQQHPQAHQCILQKMIANHGHLRQFSTQDIICKFAQTSHDNKRLKFSASYRQSEIVSWQGPTFISPQPWPAVQKRSTSERIMISDKSLKNTTLVTISTPPHQSSIYKKENTSPLKIGDWLKACRTNEADKDQ